MITEKKNYNFTPGAGSFRFSSFIAALAPLTFVQIGIRSFKVENWLLPCINIVDVEETLRFRPFNN